MPTDPRIPRSGDRIMQVMVLMGAFMAVMGPFNEGAIRYLDVQLGTWVEFGENYQKVLENFFETLLTLTVGAWWMRRIRRQDAELDEPPFSARRLIVSDEADGSVRTRTRTADDTDSAVGDGL